MREGASLQNTALQGEAQSHSRGESSKGERPCQGRQAGSG
jgi:hypothetical protein